jgi:hypothetical protein
MDEIFRLKSELASDHTDRVKVLKLKAQIRAMEDANKALSIWPLIEAGEFSTIAEGLDEADVAIREGHFSWGEAYRLELYL